MTPSRLAVTLIDEPERGLMLAALARHTDSRPGEFEIRVRPGGRAGNATFARLRLEVDDDAAAIVSIPSVAAPTHWAAVAGGRAAVVAARG